MTTLDFVGTHHIDSAGIRAGIAIIQLHNDLWRVTRPDGDVVGYIERSQTPSGSRYLAKRMLQRQRRFLPIGEFWGLDDALDCFRF
ncbi:hypothetical protein QMG83_10045 [Salinibacterium sp. G-O1]|uniref:hypothetical protein n=1 Tax=Salinibacterium sp. G-O1 TaxID=3046208 RepID=UPI0024BA26E3|nr:hypothetical protein [Salinibacterium sp. G-O1]MDJ0335563.1 hypothetical protein [Salinibacterium sp. G-O1]